MLKCGFYEKEFTPPLGCCMSGYFIKRLAEGVKIPLCVKAVAVQDDAGRCVILVTLDAQFLMNSVYQTAVKRITEATGVSAENIMINATHIHTGGPVKDYDNIPFYEMDKEFLNVYSRIIGDCAVLAYQRLAPVTVTYAKKDVRGVSFVRVYRMKDGSLRTNPGRQNPDIVEPMTDIDPELPVLFFLGEDGNPKGAVVNFALHHDCVGGTLYSSDYSGVMARELKKTFGLDFITVFLNGACGDINHIDVNMPAPPDRDVSPQIGKRLADEVVSLYSVAERINADVVNAEMEVLKIPRLKVSDADVKKAEELIERIPLEGLCIDMSNPESDVYKRANAEYLLSFHKKPLELEVPVQAIRIGDAVIFSSSGELFNEIGKEMKQNSPFSINLVAELANGGPCCYVPTKRAFTPTVYESQTGTAHLIPEAAEIIAECAVKLANKLL